VSNNRKKTIGFPSRPASKGGPGSFQKRFEDKLLDKGWEIVYPDSRNLPDVILVNGNTRHIWWLLRAKLRGKNIIYRLGGISWLYKYKPDICLIKKIKIYFKNKLIPVSQSIFGNAIIYQSEFSRKWLVKMGQSARLKDNTVIYNGVDTERFKPNSSTCNANKEISLICVEGNIDYTPYAISLLNYLQVDLAKGNSIREIRIYGDFENNRNREKLHPDIKYLGNISHNNIHEVFHNVIYLSLDINPACPNAVLEAMSCGIPIVGFDTGAIKEIVPPKAGIIVPYGSDPWRLGYPDVAALVKAIIEIREHYTIYSANARKTAENYFNLENMTRKYLDVINRQIKF